MIGLGTRGRWILKKCCWCVVPLATCTIALGLGGCGGERADRGEGARVVAQPPGVRSFSTRIDSLWSIDGAAAESLFTEAHFIAAGFGRVYVSDEERGVLALDTAGRPVWRAELPRPDGSTGGAPGAIAVLGDSVLLVADRGTNALRRLTTGGRFAGAHRLDARWAFHSFCVLSGGLLLMANGDAPLGIVRDGRTVRQPDYPWPSMRASHRMLQQTIVASSADVPGCVIAQFVGSGFAVTQNGEVFETARYVEQRPLPEIRITVDSIPDGVVTQEAMPPDFKPTADRIAVTASRIYVSFRGESPRRDGLIDVYDRATLAYRASLRLGVPIRAIAADGDLLFVLHNRHGASGLLAVRVTDGLP